MGSIVSLFANAFDLVAKVFGFQSKRLDLKNSAEMQQASEAQKELDARDATAKAISAKDVEEIRKELAE